MISILLLVLVIALVFLLVLQNKDVVQKEGMIADLKEELQQEREQASQRVKDIQDLRGAINGDRASPIEISNTENTLQEATQFLYEKRSAPEELKTEGVVLNYEELLTNYQQVLSRLYQNEKQAVEAKQTTDTKIQQEATRHQQEIKAKNDIVANLRQEVSSLRRQVEDLSSQKAEIENRFTRQLTEKADEYTQLQIEYRRSKELYEDHIQALDSTITALKIDLLIAQDKDKAPAQGEIINVANRNTAYINLGRRDFVKPGTVFEVYQKIGSKRKVKGKIEVVRVEDIFSQVTIVNEERELDPIVKNDKIWSAFYKAQEKPTFVFAGEKLETKMLSLDTLRRKLEDAGAEVSEEVDVQTDYVVALSDYQQDPKYDLARQFGVTILKEEDVLSFLLP